MISKKVFYGFLVVLMAISFLSLRWYTQDQGAEAEVTSSECSCPSLDELLSQEMTEVSMNIEMPFTGEKNDTGLSSEKTVIQEGEKGVRIVLRYDNKDILLKRASTYGLTTSKSSSRIPYHFTLNGAGERLYFGRDEAFRKFLRDIGGQRVFGQATKEIVVRLVSGSQFQLIQYN